MDGVESARLQVGQGAAAREIAVCRRRGAGPGIFWLGGYASDMRGSKAEALDAFAARTGRAFTRFDYSGHGESGGAFAEGTISRWLEEARAVFAGTVGPQVVVGSSMGGWIALLLAEALRDSGRIGGLVLVAPAVDMTRALMLAGMNARQRKELTEKGAVTMPSDYSAAGYTITRALVEDGDRHLFGERLIETGCPVHILQGLEDTDVPWRHATELVTRLASDDVVLTLVKDGDHRLSRPEDLERLAAAVEGVTATD